MHPTRTLLALAVPAIACPHLTAQTTFPALVYGSVLVGGAPHDLLLDLVVPSPPGGPWPLVVWIHGGGWSGGSRLPIPGAVTRLLLRGYAVASIDYRLTGQAIWPAQIQDCKAAIRFLRANASTWGLDPDRIGVMGSSAGGHLVAALLTMGDVGVVRSGSYVVDLEGSVGPHVGTSSRVQCAVDLFGPTNMLFADDFPTFDHDAANSPESRLVGGAMQEQAEKWATVDPITFVTPDDAPLMVLHGTDDTSVPFAMSELLVAAARAIGLDVGLLPVPDTGHGGPGFSTAAVTAATDAFFDRTLRDLPTTVVGVTASDGIADESGDTATFVVSRSGSTSSPLTVRVWLAGDVEPGVDGEPTPPLVTIPAGQASATLTFVPKQDALVEDDESLVLHVVPTGAYRIDHTAERAVAILVDDEVATGLPVVSLQPLDPIATEASGNPGAIRIVRTGSTAQPLTVHYRTAGSATNGGDCVLLNGTATIAAGSVAALVLVQPLQDVQREPAETVVLQLAAAADYVRGVARSAHVGIADDDRTSPLPVVGVIATDPDLGEPGDGGAFTITRTGSTAQPLAVQCTIGGFAQPGSDVAALASVITIPVGAAWTRVPIDVLDDSAVEGVENLVLSIVPSPAYVTSLLAIGEVWVADDEAPPPPPSSVRLAMGPLTVGCTAYATLAGGSPAGVTSLWLGLAPDYVPLPPYGVVGFDAGLGGVVATELLDADGAVTLPLAVPDSSSLVGLPTWWQAITTTATAPFLVLSDVVARRITPLASVVGGS